MADIAVTERQTRLQNELDMALAIAQQTATYEKAGFTNWMGTLSPGGWRPQDIQLAAQVYGGMY